MAKKIAANTNHVAVDNAARSAASARRQIVAASNLVASKVTLGARVGWTFARVLVVGK